MGRVAIVLSFERGQEDDGAPKAEIKCDPGGGANVTVPYFDSCGTDAPPLPGDAIALQDLTGSGTEQSAGCEDAKNPGKALPGEHRIYARDSDGNVVCEFHLKGTGAFRLENNGGFIELADDGVVTINGVKIDPQSNVKAPGEVTAMSDGAAVNLSTHKHPTAMGPSGPPTPG